VGETGLSQQTQLSGRLKDPDVKDGVGKTSIRKGPINRLDGQLG